ncbi:MAG: DUF484 family protein [Thiomargarita sp.]|nr:DUF484 family protein [Thiomargarita sp.]
MEKQFEELSENAVIEYLQNYPEFFTKHQPLFADIYVSQQEMIDLNKASVKIRDENQQLKNRLAELINVAQDNEDLNQKIKHLISSLMYTTGLDEFFNTLYDTLCKDFNTDVATIRYFKPQDTNEKTLKEFVEYDANVFALFDDLLKSDKPLCGRKMSEQQIKYFFPDENIESMIIIPLGAPESEGLLAMGSKDATHFRDDMCTDLLEYLGELIDNLLNIWIRNNYN